MTKRTDRLDSEFQREIAAILAGAFKDKIPGVRGIVSVTEADVAPDLKTAKVYLSVYATSKEEEAATFALITQNAGFIRRELAHRMRLRTVPALTFLKDGSMEYGSRMDELFSKLHKDN